MSRRLTALLAAALLGLSGAAATGCSTDDAAEREAREAARDADKAAGDTDEKAKKAGDDAVDSIDDDDGK